jgi:hypothetical protein
VSQCKSSIWMPQQNQCTGSQGTDHCTTHSIVCSPPTLIFKTIFLIVDACHPQHGNVPPCTIFSLVPLPSFLFKHKHFLVFLLFFHLQRDSSIWDKRGTHDGLIGCTDQQYIVDVQGFTDFSLWHFVHCQNVTNGDFVLGTRKFEDGKHIGLGGGVVGGVVGNETLVGRGGRRGGDQLFVTSNRCG